MVSLVTAGGISEFKGLKKASIKVMGKKGKPPEEISVLFNPSEYTMSKSISWTAALKKDRDSPGLEYKNSEVETLTMDLFFDTYEANKDVRKYTDKITNLAKIDPDSHAPPILRFTWGSLIGYYWVLTSVTKKFTMFRQDGVPVRATLSVTFTEYGRENQKPRENSSDRTKAYIVKEGDSLWSIAAEEYNDPAQWRAIAYDNNISNPRLLEPGMRLKIPPL